MNLVKKNYNYSRFTKMFIFYVLKILWITKKFMSLLKNKVKIMILEIFLKWIMIIKKKQYKLFNNYQYHKSQ